MSLDLDLGERLALWRHNARVALGSRSRRRVGLRQADGMVIVTTDAGEIAVPSALRWRHYRKGLAHRLELLAAEYGFDRFGGDVGAGSNVVDIGANVGEFALHVGRRGARCTSIEADPDVHACLARNIAGQTGLTAIRTLLWHEETELTFWSAPRHADSSVFRPETGGVEKTLPARPLDAVLGEDDTQIDYLKCDAEGAEPEVLRGAGRTLARSRVVAVDTGPEREGESTAEPVSAILREAGFDVEQIQTGKRSVTIGRRS